LWAGLDGLNGVGGGEYWLAIRGVSFADTGRGWVHLLQNIPDREYLTHHAAENTLKRLKTAVCYSKL
jgi:hypothetical protein